ncbi:FHA domain-containing protein [Chitinivibrio alkaliphilus]|uniref:FHA domain-containing protein n=1 Tax=Chitinivibrio alkaliphilus ACht1 TaxID=1313304 RepID=U7D5Z3_9BACT|nr:FHA domain-containing protein [Chitinivibrio alkaliphilus]ERP31353.1 hypothetical protein CALK_1698 [Chitinivibrio alkaliphilus ACht1]
MLNIIIKHKATPIKTYQTAKDGATLGRLKTNDIIIQDLAVSRTHLKFEFPEDGSAPLVHDLGSLNGTYMNGKKIETLRVENVFALTVGDFTIELIPPHSSSPAPETPEPAHLDGTPAHDEEAPVVTISEEPPPAEEEESLIFSSSDKNSKQEKNSKDISQYTTENRGILIEVERQIVYKINKTPMTLGNTDDDDIYVEGGVLSAGKIATLRVSSEGEHILRASNKFTGKFKINDKKVSEAILHHGDKIKIGNSKFSFMLKTG